MSAREQESARLFLRNLLLDVPLARGAGDPPGLLAALARGALFTPVFQQWETQVPGWIEEALPLAADLGEVETRRLLELRAAAVDLRRSRLDEAAERLAALDNGSTPAAECYAATLRARLALRRQRFDDAERALADAERTEPEGAEWIAALPGVARAELLIERDDQPEAALAAVRATLKSLPEVLVEERIQLLQLLAFLRISRREPKPARRALERVRELLAAAGAWHEVITTNLTLANLLIPAGRGARAAELLEEGLALCDEWSLSLWRPALEMGLARTGRAAGRHEDAVQATLSAAVSFARQGNALAYTAMIGFLATLRLEAGDPKEAYRVLALGVSIAKRLRYPLAEASFRSQIAALRDQIDPERFDALVRELIDESRDREEG